MAPWVAEEVGEGGELCCSLLRSLRRSALWFAGRLYPVEAYDFDHGR